MAVFSLLFARANCKATSKLLSQFRFRLDLLLCKPESTKKVEISYLIHCNQLCYGHKKSLFLITLGLKNQCWQSFFYTIIKPITAIRSLVSHGFI